MKEETFKFAVCTDLKFKQRVYGLTHIIIPLGEQNICYTVCTWRFLDFHIKQSTSIQSICSIKRKENKVSD